MEQPETTQQTTNNNNQNDARLRALVLGGTGAIGKQLVHELLKSDAVEHITTLGRREVALPEQYANSTKIVQHVINMAEMGNYQKDFENHNVAFCCLGTTRKDAGSAEAFRKVDYDYVVQFARMAKQANVNHFLLVSSMGANANSWFLYPKTKGQVENAVKELQFPRTSIFRPGLLDRGQEARTVEKLAGIVMPKIGVWTVAQGMLATAIKQQQHPEQTVDLFENTAIKNHAKELTH